MIGFTPKYTPPKYTIHKYTINPILKITCKGYANGNGHGVGFKFGCKKNIGNNTTISGGINSFVSKGIHPTGFGVGIGWNF